MAWIIKDNRVKHEINVTPVTALLDSLKKI